MNKVDAYRQMADQATQSLTAQVKDWCRFLVCAGRFYKYGFMDQVMIHAQRPAATACAEFDLWTRRMKRGIRRGSKGIALLRYRDGRLFLRYVFDVADTVRRENARDPRPWTYRDEYEAAVTARLEECFGMPADNKGLANQLIALSIQFAEERWHDFKYEIMHSLRGSRLDGLDEDNVSVRFQSAALVSLAFLLLARCGFDLDEYFAENDLDCIGDFDAKDVILALGNAVSESANVILRQMEYAIRKYERDKAVGNLLSEASPVDVPAPSADGAVVEDPSPAQPP